MEVLFLIGRIIFGGFFIYNAINHLRNAEGMSGYAGSKGIKSPKNAVIGTGILLLLGGAGVVLGIYPRISLILLLIFLIPVTFIMHAYWKIEDPQAKAAEQIQFMKNLALIGASIALLAAPLPWDLSL